MVRYGSSEKSENLPTAGSRGETFATKNGTYVHTGFHNDQA